MPYKVVRKSPRRKMMKRKQYKRKVVVASVSPVVKSYVKRMLSVRAEDKIAPNVSQPITTITPMTATLTQSINLANVWNLTQGSQQGNRIGNSVSPKSWRIKGFFSASNFTGASAVPYIIKLYIVRLKNGFQTPSSSVNFYQNGNSSIAPAGNFNDMLKSVNLDVFTLYTTRTFKVGPAAYVSSNGASTNNDFKLLCPFNINLLKYQNHQMKYSDSATANPTNSGLYMVYTACLADGSNPGTFITPNISWEIEATYEDA